MQACEGEHPAQIKHITSKLPAYRQKAGATWGTCTGGVPHVADSETRPTAREVRVLRSLLDYKNNTNSMATTKMNVRGTLTKMKPGTQMMFTSEVVSLRYLRNVTSDLKDQGFLFSVNKEDTLYRVTRIA